MTRLFIILVSVGCALFARSSGIVVSYRMDYSGVIDSNYGGAPTACWNFDSAIGGTYTDDCANTYTMTVNGSPTRVQDSTYPDGIDAGPTGYAWYYDGSNDYLSRENDGTFTPTGDFSIQCVFTISDDADTGQVAGKWKSGQRSWLFYYSNANIYLYISHDGVSTSAVSKPNSLALLRPAFVTATYQYIGPSNSIAKIYVDNLSTAINTSTLGPPYQSTSGDFTIGDIHGGGGGLGFNGTISYCAYFDSRVLSESEHDELYSWFSGRTSTAGPTVSADVSSASPPSLYLTDPSSGQEPYIVPVPANGAQVGQYGIYSAPAIDNLCYRRSLETWSAGSPTGWVETSAGGTSDATQNTTNMAAGLSSAQMLCDGTNMLTLASGCTALSASTAYYLDANLKTTAGTADFYLDLIEYTSADCSTGATTTTVYNGNPGADWVRHGGARTTGGSVQSGRVQLRLDTNSAAVLADAVQLIAGSDPVDAFCDGDTNAVASCTAISPSATTVSTLSVADWQVEMTVRSPVDGAVASPARTIYYLPGTAGNNNRAEMTWASDTLTCSVYDSAGSAKTSTVAAAGNANTDYSVSIGHCYSNTTDGYRVTCCWDGTCDATPAVNADTDAVDSDMYFGYAGNVHVRNVPVLRRCR